MTSLQKTWSESISVGSTDPAGRGRYRRSVSCTRPGRSDIRRREGVRLGMAPTPSGFAESVFCYVGGAGISGSGSTRRHHKSAVKYCGVGVTARRFFETCFILPTSSATHLSHVQSDPLADTSPRWYTAALKLSPRHSSLPDSPGSPAFDDWSSLRHVVTSSPEADSNNNDRRGGNFVQPSFRSHLVVHVQHTQA